MSLRLSHAAALSFALSAPISAQSLASRVTASDGVVQIVYPSRPGACGDGQSFIGNLFGNGRYQSGAMNWSSRDGWSTRQCVHGPARVVATVVSGEVTRARAFVGPIPPSSADVRTIGVSAAEASSWMGDIVSRGTSRVASELVLPLILADGPEPWPLLIKVARDENRSRDLKRNVMLWLSNGVSEHLGLADSDDGSSEDEEMRKQAIYVLSQRPKNESIPQLIEIARSLKHPASRKTAIYWLGQSGDPRAVDVYAELLGIR
jgi:hypothetical protein